MWRIWLKLCGVMTSRIYYMIIGQVRDAIVIIIIVIITSLSSFTFIGRDTVVRSRRLVKHETWSKSICSSDVSDGSRRSWIVAAAVLVLVVHGPWLVSGQLSSRALSWRCLISPRHWCRTRHRGWVNVVCCNATTHCEMFWCTQQRGWCDSVIKFLLLTD